MPSKRTLALIAAFLAGLLVFPNVWPGAGTPYLAWLPPFLVYALWPPLSAHVRPKLAVGIANAALLAAYHFALRLLAHWQDQSFRDFAEHCRRNAAALACPAGPATLYPPPPPAYWEWAAAKPTALNSSPSLSRGGGPFAKRTVEGPPGRRKRAPPARCKCGDSMPI
jgi:hypothetical protein